MAPAANTDQARKQDKTKKCLLAVVVILIALCVASIAAIRGAGGWLVREDALGPADVIVVLSGGLPYRAESAATLYRGGIAPEVWVSLPENPGADLASLGVHFVGEEEYNREILIQLGVPAAAVRILPEAIVDTQQEIEEIAREMRLTGKKRVVIVTSPPHTRRVEALWRKLVGNDPKIVVRAAPDDPFDAVHWWRNTRDSLSVVREYLGLLNVWTGLPVRPHSRRRAAHRVPSDEPLS